MANEQNLIKNSERTPKERKEIARKGGIASGVAKRKKKEFKKIIEQALNTDIPNEQTQKVLEKLGFDTNFQSAIALKLVESATKGDMRAVSIIHDMTNKKDNLDRKEQRERIKRLELENQRLRELLGEKIGQDDKIVHLLSELKKEVTDG